MATIDDLRSLFPDAQSDSDIIKQAATRYGIDPMEIASELGVKISAPGFGTSIKRGLGQVESAIGSTARDLGLDRAGRALESYGEDVAFRNPAAVNTVGEALSSPYQTAKEALGELVPQIGVSGATALGGRVIGGALGAPLGPAGVVAGQSLGATAGAFAGNLIQEYGGIRSEQRESGKEDRLRALGTGGAAAVLDTAFGAERLVNKIGNKGLNFLSREAGEKLTPHVLKQTALGVAGEAGTEVAQTGLERVGAFKNLLGDDALNEYGMAAIKGGIGGGVLRGGASAFAGQRAPAADTNDISQAIASKDTVQPDVTTQQFQAPAAPAQQMREQITEDGEIIQVPVAPAVAGGSTEVAQAQQQAQAAQQQQEAQAQQAQAAEQAAQQFGVVNPASPAVGSAFGQKVYGPNIPAVANAIATFTSKMPPQQVQLAQAITKANAETGGKLIKFQFNANDVMASVDKGFQAVGKVAAQLQINHVDSVEEAAAILDDQSTQLKGDKLEQVNAIHQALTGQDTTGYQAEQQAKGAKDERLQLQNNAGLREIPVQGGAGEASNGGDGSVRPTEVQPVGAGSVGAGPSDVQAGQPSAGGVRASADAGANTGISEPVGSGQGQVNVQVEPTVQSAAQVAEERRPDENLGAVPTGEQTVEEQRVEEVPDLIRSALRMIYKSDRKVDLLLRLTEKTQRGEYAALAKEYEVTEQYVKELASDAITDEGETYPRFILANLDKFMSAVNFQAEKSGISLLEALDALQTIHDVYEGGLASQLGTETNEADLINNGLEIQNVKERKDSQGKGTGKVDRTNVSDLAEEGNKMEALMQQYLDLSNELEAATEANDERAADLEAQVATLTAKIAEAEKKEKARVRAMAGKQAPKETDNAVQVESTDEGDVREPASGGEAVGKRNTKPKKPAGKAEQAKGESKAQEEIKTPQEQYEALAKATNLLPPYESLDARERAQVEDQAHQGELTLASLNTMFKGNAKFGIDTRAKNPYTAAELTKELKAFTRTKLATEKLTIVDSVTDLLMSPDEDTQKLGAILYIEGAYGVAVDGKAYLIANRIERGNGRAKFMHEVGAHLGLENLLPEAMYNRLTQQIVDWAKADNDTIESILATRAAQRVMDANTPKQDQRAEMLAYFVEEAVQFGIDPTATQKSSGLREWMRTLMAAFKAALQKLGLNPEALIARDVVDMAFGAAQMEMTDGSTAGTARPKFGFAGVKAVGAATGEKQASLAAAQLDLANGVDPQTIWEQTGWHKGTDGQWRFEIDDSKAQFKGILEGRSFRDIARMDETTLGEVLDHDELFAQYPELRDVKFEVRSIPLDVHRATQGWFDIEQNKLFVTPYAIDPLSTVLHEAQHWIQNKEGFENGANPNGSDLSNKAALNKLRTELTTTIGQAEALKADQKAAIKEGRYVSIFDSLMAASKAEDLVPAVDALLARGSEIAPMYAQLRTLDAEIERVEKARKVLAQKQKEQNKQAGVIKKVIDYAGQMKDLRVYSDKAREAQKQRDEINRQLKASIIDITGGKDVAYELYRLVAGEAEARNVQTRQKLTAEERKAKSPLATMDVRAENTLRSTGRGGAYMSMRFGKEAAQPAGVFAKAGEWLDGALTSPKETFRKLKLGFLTLDQLAELDKTPGQVVRGYSDVMTAMQKLSKDMVYKAAQIDQLWAKLSTKDSEAVSQVMRDATRAQFDPSLSVAGKNQVELDIASAYRALQPNAKDVYAKVKKYYEDAFQTRLAIMEESAAKLGGKELKDIQEAYSKLKGPYFPLGRTGRYYAVGMSPRVAELTAKKESEGLTSSETTELSGLRKKADQYKTSSFNSLYDAKKASEKFKAEMGSSYYNEVEENIETAMSKMPNFAKLEESITTKLGGETRAEVKSMLSQLMFDALPEHHALKNQMRREGIYGENEDMRQVFAQTSISQAHYISRLQFGGELNNAMLAIAKTARQDIEMRQIQNELKLRTKLSMDNTQSALTDAMVNASYFAHLGLSPAFLLTNMTQVPMITAPWLGSRHGMGATKRAMAMALADTAKIIKSSFKDGDWRSEIDWTEQFPAGSNEDRMFRDLLDRNVLDITMEHDLAAVASAQKGLFDDKISKATNNKLGGMSDVVKLVNTPVRITELANRAVTALSAYRLKMEALATAPMTAEERHTAAVNYAARAVSETQLNYSELNAPRHMRQVFGSKPLAKMIFQFRKYQQGMLYLIAKNISDSMPGSKVSKEDRRIARRTIAGLYMTTGLMAGTTGMPLMGTVGVAGIANLIAAAFGDEDEPWDFETEYRNFLTDWLGHDAALLVAKGLPAYLGADLSKRVGMGDIANPIPFVQRGATGQSTVANVLYAAGGAPIGMVGTMYDGIVAMANGDVMKGMEKVIPVKAVKDALRTYRYADEGMTDKRGNVILTPEKFDAWDLTLRGMGFTPTKESEYYAANAAMQEAKMAATDVRTRLLREYSEAKLKGESTADVDAKITEFNERHPEKSVKIDMSTKLKSVQARRKMAAERTESGLRVGKYEKPFASAARFAEEQ